MGHKAGDPRLWAGCWGASHPARGSCIPGAVGAVMQPGPPEALSLPSVPQEEKRRLSRNMTESSLGSSEGKQPLPSRDSTGAQPSTAGTPHHGCWLRAPSWALTCPLHGWGWSTFPSPYSPKQHPALVSTSRSTHPSSAATSTPSPAPQHRHPHPLAPSSQWRRYVLQPGAGREHLVPKAQARPHTAHTSPTECSPWSCQLSIPDLVPLGLGPEISSQWEPAPPRPLLAGLTPHTTPSLSAQGRHAPAGRRAGPGSPGHPAAQGTPTGPHGPPGWMICPAHLPCLHRAVPVSHRLRWPCEECQQGPTAAPQDQPHGVRDIPGAE